MQHLIRTLKRDENEASPVMKHRNERNCAKRRVKKREEKKRKGEKGGKNEERNKDGRESNVRNIANGNVAHYLVAGLTMCTTDHPQQYLSFLADRERKTEKEGREERHTDQKGIELAGEKERTLFSFSLILSLPLSFSFPFIRFTWCTVREHRKRGMERQKKRKGERRQSTIGVQMKIQITHAYVSRGSSRASSIG